MAQISDFVIRKQGQNIYRRKDDVCNVLKSNTLACFCTGLLRNYGKLNTKTVEQTRISGNRNNNSCFYTEWGKYSKTGHPLTTHTQSL
jgi:hypothetical protein